MLLFLFDNLHISNLLFSLSMRFWRISFPSLLSLDIRFSYFIDVLIDSRLPPLFYSDLTTLLIFHSWVSLPSPNSFLYSLATKHCWMKLLTLVPDTIMIIKLLGNYWYYVFVSFLLYTCRGFRSSPIFSNYQNPWLFYRLEFVLISHCLQLYWEYCLLNFSVSSISQYYSVSSTNIYFLLVEEIWLHSVKTNNYLYAFVLTLYMCHHYTSLYMCHLLYCLFLLSSKLLSCLQLYLELPSPNRILYFSHCSPCYHLISLLITFILTCQNISLIFKIFKFRIKTQKII